MTIRVWAEYMTPGELLEKSTMELLARYDVIPGIAFPPGSMEGGFEKVLGEYAGRGIQIALWPLLEDKYGYWPNERNVNEFSDYVGRICDWADSKGVSFSWLAIDMEPPWYQMEALKNGTLKEKAEGLKKVFDENRDRGRF